MCVQDEWHSEIVVVVVVVRGINNGIDFLSDSCSNGNSNAVVVAVIVGPKV